MLDGEEHSRERRVDEEILGRVQRSLVSTAGERDEQQDAEHGA